MNIHSWKFEKKKVNCSKRPSEKKHGLEQKQKKKMKRKKKGKKEVEVQFELYCVKLVELMICEEKLCSTSL